MTHMLRIFLAGLCALVPSAKDLAVSAKDLAVLMMDPNDPYWSNESPCTPNHMKHVAVLSAPVEELVQNETTESYSYLISNDKGGEDAVFDLTHKIITLNPVPPGRPFSTAGYWIQTEVPHWFLPFEEEDSRWAIDGATLMKNSSVKPAVLQDKKGLNAFVYLRQGRLKTAALLKALDGSYRDFTFDTYAGQRVAQALAEKVAVEIPFNFDPQKPHNAPVVFTITDLDGGHSGTIALSPAVGEDIEISISNLPDHIPNAGESHFGCYCFLAQDRTGCKDLNNYVENAVITATGISCPLITLHQ